MARMTVLQPILCGENQLALISPSKIIFYLRRHDGNVWVLVRISHPDGRLGQAQAQYRGRSFVAGAEPSSHGQGYPMMIQSALNAYLEG